MKRIIPILPLLIILIMVSCDQESPVKFGEVKEPVFLFQLIDKSSGNDFFEVYDSIYSIEAYSISPQTFRKITLWTFDTLNTLIIRPNVPSSGSFNIIFDNGDTYAFELFAYRNLLEPEKITLWYNDGSDSTVLDFEADKTLFPRIQENNSFVYGEKPEGDPVVFPIYLVRK